MSQKLRDAAGMALFCLLTLLMVVLVIWAVSTRLRAGEVYHKGYEPPRQEIQLMKVGDTTMPMPVDIPARYMISIRQMDESSGTWRTRTLEVSYGVWGKLEVGSWYEE